MATINGITAEKAQEILDSTIESITLVGGVFTATLHDGVTTVPIGNFSDAVATEVAAEIDSELPPAVASAVSGSLIDKGNITGTVSFSGITAAELNNSLIKATLVGNITIAAADLPSGATPGTQFAMILTQDATGSRTLTLTGIKRSLGVLNLSTAANSVDIISFLYDGTTWYAGVMGLAFS